jgi:hypothetical protein
MKLALVFCFLIILGSSATAVYAQTPIDPGSIIPDAKVHNATPDGCNPPFEICFQYTGPTLHKEGNGSVLHLFFKASPDPTEFNPLTTSFQCDVTGTSAQAAAAAGLKGVGSNDPMTCKMVLRDPPGKDDFLGMKLNVPGAFHDETFGESVSGGVVSFGSTGGLTCISGCNPDGSWTVDPTPEPSSSVLFMTGLLLFSLGGFARKRLGANFSA